MLATIYCKVYLTVYKNIVIINDGYSNTIFLENCPTIMNIFCMER